MRARKPKSSTAARAVPGAIPAGVWSLVHRARSAVAGHGVRCVALADPALATVQAVAAAVVAEHGAPVEHVGPLLDAVRRHAAELYTDAAGFDADAPPELGGMLRWDALLADRLDGLGQGGREDASKLRRRSSERWAAADGRQGALFRVGGGVWLDRRIGDALLATDLPFADPPVADGDIDATNDPVWWLWGPMVTPNGWVVVDDPRLSVAPPWALSGDANDAPKWLSALVLAVWLGEVAPRVSTQERKGPGAVALPWARDVAALRRTTIGSSARLDRNPLVPVASGPYARAITADLLAVLERGAGHLDTPTADRTMAGLLDLGRELFGLGPDRMSYDRWFTGGWGEVARRFGLTGNKAPTEMRAVIELLSVQTVGWDIKGVSRGTPFPLVRVVEEAAAPGRPARVGLGLHPVWTPKLSNLLIGSDRLLVPWLPLPDLSFLHTRHQRAAVALWRGVRVAMRERAAPLLSGSGVDIPWSELARQVGFPAAEVARAVEQWTGPDGPLVAQPFGGVHPRDPAILAMLTDGAALQSSRSTAGRKAVAARRRKRK